MLVIVDYGLGNLFSVEKAFEMIKLMQRPSATTIEVAETFGAIQTALFSKTNDLFETYFYAAPDTAVDRFVDLVNFFIGVKPDKIWYVVDAYMHPDRYQEEPAKKENKENLETASPSISEKPSYAEIKQTIESSYSIIIVCINNSKRLRYNIFCAQNSVSCPPWRKHV
jgi:hypothetical protein